MVTNEKIKVLRDTIIHDHMDKEHEVWRLESWVGVELWLIRYNTGSGVPCFDRVTQFHLFDDVNGWRVFPGYISAINAYNAVKSVLEGDSNG